LPGAVNNGKGVRAEIIKDNIMMIFVI